MLQKAEEILVQGQGQGVITEVKLKLDMKEFFFNLLSLESENDVKAPQKGQFSLIGKHFIPLRQKGKSEQKYF